ncbi:hypothetical protein Y1Q_0002647 [Alligator mississippiensis]|uniref:Uncharacterized protein n=1 Tax=Alligator mississippiensis TaxID=8496 RepID=A0A151NZI2_ALLMI|nr:hypothetical protein Y1Q_0002647 [Alligator mississippiensis]
MSKRVALTNRLQSKAVYAGCPTVVELNSWLRKRSDPTKHGIKLQRSGTGVPEIGKRSRLSSSTCPRSNNKLRSAERVLLCLCFAATPVGVSTRPYLGWFQPHIIEGLCAYC